MDWSWFSKIDPNLVFAVVTTVGGWVWHKLSGNQRTVLDRALEAAGNVMNQVVTTARPGLTVADLITQLKGAVAIQLARVGLKTDGNPLVKASVDKLVSSYVDKYVAGHPDPKSLDLPMRKK
jgi:crotonobetainyl-CoA:carnitine CoA-transferase CaiB-like acyl-CoA transferase